MRWPYIFLLVVLYIVYLLIGAAIFFALEYAHEEQQCNKTMEELQAAFDKLGSNVDSAFSSNSSFNGDDLRNLIRVRCGKIKVLFKSYILAMNRLKN